MKKKHIEELLDSALELYEEEMDKKEELQNRIDKAIEYIEQKEISIIYQELGLQMSNTKQELLEILKGEQ